MTPTAPANDFRGTASLCRSALAGGARLGIHVRGTSMLPVFWPGEKLWVEGARATELRIDDVIVYARDRQLVVHRIIGIARDGNRMSFITRGDAQHDEDAPVEPAAVLGIVRSVRRFGVDWPVGGRPALAARMVSRLVRRSEMARFLLAALRSRWNKGTMALRLLRTARGTPPG